LFAAVTIGATMSQAKATNPIIWSDVPDISIVRVGKNYYMSSTTMHMSPGLPIMKSTDLIHWKLISYAYSTLADVDALNLSNGKNAYGKGSWASSLRYQKGIFYATTFSSTTGKTHVFRTSNPEKTPWDRSEFAPSLHDHSLIFEPNDRVFMAYGAGNIKLAELNSDLSGIKPGTTAKTIVANASVIAGEPVGLPAEGTQVFRINGMYYIVNIAWPRGGMRTAIIHRSSQLEGPYESRILLKDQGVAQGGIIDTPDGRWFAYLFQDHGAVGRIPFLVPLTWKDGWPIAGIDGKVPMELDLPRSKNPIDGIISSDEFSGKSMPLAWQWNHNPDPLLWSKTERSGYLRLRTGRIDASVIQARNTLTQRTFGPTCTGVTKLDVKGLREGDRAGLIALQGQYASIGVKVENGLKSVVMVANENNKVREVASSPLVGDSVFLRMKCDFRERKDIVQFSFSLDGKMWSDLGTPHRLRYDLDHFMGCRFGLFCFSTQSPGGFADFDFFRVSE
jgi:beta-xylosidase